MSFADFQDTTANQANFPTATKVFNASDNRLVANALNTDRVMPNHR